MTQQLTALVGQYSSTEELQDQSYGISLGECILAHFFSLQLLEPWFNYFFLAQYLTNAWFNKGNIKET